ncbi:patatin-like phospholipase family protein [Oceanicoccus sp. KOV_DT_Chl]|uniref:patatin-like phospholipase family protein n=1 Tax=Oceanicoccus sp. KOV_DT_Chl TaxID=1904639 RepID=UPI001F488AA4|nr:patatin-like phospholipase family protein [Oceanicoccus sp. KOV_DT_Chl]
MEETTTLDNNSQTALILPGGGARAAYQVGVLKALATITDDPHPFPILCGTSAGALNAVALASNENEFKHSCAALEKLWLDLNTDKIYRSDWIGILRNARRLLLSIFNSGIAVGRPVALLDNVPLKQLLREKIDFSGIGRNLQNKKITAVSVTAMNYTERVSVTFFQGGPGKADWHRWRRQGIPTPLQLRHLLASTAIPTIFPPQRIGRNYYGDGALRQLTPISPALHLGADKVLIISASGHKKEYQKPHSRIHSPAFGQVIGHLLNSAFIDSLETDIELLEQMNRLLELSSAEITNQEGRTLKPIDFHIISPSEDIDTLADEHISSLPRSIRTFLKVSGGTNNGGVNIASYLLFTPDFCKHLIDLGYRDGLAQAEEIKKFLDN